MRNLRRNKQKMFYALPGNEYDEYMKDDDGNTLYQEIDGELIPVPTGTRRTGYFEPVEFHSSIKGNLNEMHAKSYGVDQSSLYAEICCKKGYLPLKYNMKVWKDDEIGWIDGGNKIPDPDTATYTVKGILSEYQDYDWLLLQRNNIQEEDTV